MIRPLCLTILSLVSKKKDTAQESVRGEFDEQVFFYCVLYSMTNFCWVVINILKLVWIFKLLSHIIYSHKECKERAKHKMSTVKFLLYILQVSITPNMHDCVSFLAVLKGGKGLLIEEKLTKNTILTYFSKLPLTIFYY